MHPTPEKFDVFILGSGPAGLCAAIRLLDMGYTVGLIEQKEFPRPQIGESLSPGIFNIFKYLHAAHLLDDARYLKNVSAEVLWESKENIYHRSGVQSGGLIVDRGKLDKDLLNFTVSKGLYLLQPAKLKDQMHAENMWTLTVLYNKTEMKFNTSIVLVNTSIVLIDNLSRQVFWIIFLHFGKFHLTMTFILTSQNVLFGLKYGQFLKLSET